MYINSSAKSRKRQLRLSLKRLNQHFPLLSFYYIIFRMPFVMYELLEIQKNGKFTALVFQRTDYKNTRPPCLWTGKLETRSTPLFSRMALWSLRRSASETLDACTMTSRMSPTSTSSRVSLLYFFSELIKNSQISSHSSFSRLFSACQSLTSRGYLKQQFAWRHFYWVLTNEGVEYLREYLNLPAEIVPQTMKKAPKIVNDRPRGGGRVGLPTQAYSQDNRDAYRREKDANVGAGEATGYSSNLEFISKISSLISKKIRSVFISCIPNYRATSPSVELDEASNRQYLPTVLPHWKPTSNKGDSIKNANVLAPVVVSYRDMFDRISCVSFTFVFISRKIASSN